jgi:thiamine phosphate synthase YjbQ (UPF0047 family)
MGKKVLSVKTSQRSQMVEITREVQAVVGELKLMSGVAMVYCPHTTSCVAKLPCETAGKSG